MRSRARPGPPCCLSASSPGARPSGARCSCVRADARLPPCRSCLKQNHKRGANARRWRSGRTPRHVQGARHQNPAGAGCAGCGDRSSSPSAGLLFRASIVSSWVGGDDNCSTNWQCSGSGGSDSRCRCEVRCGHVRHRPAQGHSIESDPFCAAYTALSSAKPGLTSASGTGRIVSQFTRWLPPPTTSCPVPGFPRLEVVRAAATSWSAQQASTALAEQVHAAQRPWASTAPPSWQVHSLMMFDSAKLSRLLLRGPLKNSSSEPISTDQRHVTKATSPRGIARPRLGEADLAPCSRFVRSLSLNRNGVGQDRTCRAAAQREDRCPRSLPGQTAARRRAMASDTLDPEQAGHESRAGPSRPRPRAPSPCEARRSAAKAKGVRPAATPCGSSATNTPAWPSIRPATCSAWPAELLLEIGPSGSSVMPRTQPGLVPGSLGGGSGSSSS